MAISIVPPVEAEDVFALDSTQRFAQLAHDALDEKMEVRREKRERLHADLATLDARNDARLEGADVLRRLEQRSSSHGPVHHMV